MRSQFIKPTHFRWIIISLIFCITVTNYIDRSAVSFAIDKMAFLFNLNQTQVGLILGAFGIGYVVTTFAGGIAVDKYGARRILFWAVLLWSFSLLVMGLASGFVMAFLSRVLLGFAEGPNFPATTRVVSDWLPKPERARAFSYSLIAVPIALAIGGPIVSELVLYLGWRGMFFILGAMSLIWLPVWWFLFRDFPNNSAYVNEAELHLLTHHDKQNNLNAQQTPGLWRFLFTNKTLLANYWAFFVFGYFLFFFMTWLPSYLTERYQMHLKQIGLFTILPWTLSAILIGVVGWLSDVIVNKTGNYRWARSYPIAISQLVAALCILPIIYSIHTNIALLFISLAVGFSMSANAAFNAVNVDIVPERTGTANGIMEACFAVSAFVAPAATGWIVHVTGQFTSAFLLLIGLGMSSVIAVLIFHRPDSSILLPVVTSNGEKIKNSF